MALPTKIVMAADLRFSNTAAKVVALECAVKSGIYSRMSTEGILARAREFENYLAEEPEGDGTDGAQHGL